MIELSWLSSALFGFTEPHEAILGIGIFEKKRERGSGGAYVLFICPVPGLCISRYPVYSTIQIDT